MKSQNQEKVISNSEISINVCIENENEISIKACIEDEALTQKSIDKELAATN